MIRIQRFSSFDLIKSDWHDLENQSDHYPFQSFWYQQLFANGFCQTADVYLLGMYDADTLLAVGGFERIGNKILLLGMKQVLGGQDLSDYGDLLFHPSVSPSMAEGIWKATVDYFATQKFATMQLDFIRKDSRTYRVFSSFNNTLVTKQEVSPFIIIPSSWDEYLASLSRKDRHELKRKIKRFEEQQAFHFCSDKTIKQDFEDFIRLHRLSDTAKEKFMSENMKTFFWDIVAAQKEDYRVDFCFLEIDNKRVASIMSLVGQQKTLLYNSGFDPQYSYYSVGLILHSYLVKKSIEEQVQIHDFLRGKERYKYDLGAEDMQLYRINVELT